MKERPILFSAPMVRALLAGTKTQTRRVVKPAYVNNNGYSMREVVHGEAARKLTGTNDRAYVGFGHPSSSSLAYFGCPYGQLGDRLVVRETWRYAGFTDDGEPYIGYKADAARKLCDRSPFEWADRLEDVFANLSEPSNYNIDQRAADRKWRPSIHMPRWASRITLEIVGVRVERLNDISEADAVAEGVDVVSMADLPRQATMSRRADFKQLWESINGAGSWDANPWVWVVGFRRLP